LLRKSSKKYSCWDEINYVVCSFLIDDEDLQREINYIMLRVHECEMREKERKEILPFARRAETHGFRNLTALFENKRFDYIFF